MQETRAHLLELQRLAADPTIGNRGALLGHISDLFFVTAEQQSEADAAVFGTILERVAFEVEMEARARLAERFSDAARAPQGLIRRLAADEIAIARPILERSPRLSDDDLLAIARARGQEHLFAISGRQRLSPPVTDVIVERGDETVLTRVAGNSGARFSSGGLAEISRRASDHAPIRTALEARGDFPDDMRSRIEQTVTARLTRELADAGRGFDQAEIAALVEQRTAALDLASVQASNEKLDRMRGAGQITERMLCDFARARRLAETVRCLALLSGLKDAMVAHCLLKAHLCALGVLCKANGFANTTYAALIQIRTASVPLRGSVIAAAMRGYDTLPRETAERMLQFVCEEAGRVESGP